MTLLETQGLVKKHMEEMRHGRAERWEGRTNTGLSILLCFTPNSTLCQQHRRPAMAEKENSLLTFMVAIKTSPKNSVSISSQKCATLCIIYEPAHNKWLREFFLGARGSEGMAASFAFPYPRSETLERLVNCRLFKQAQPKGGCCCWRSSL